jgi:hypothetical protein
MLCNSIFVARKCFIEGLVKFSFLPKSFELWFLTWEKFSALRLVLLAQRVSDKSCLVGVYCKVNAFA